MSSFSKLIARTLIMNLNFNIVKKINYSNKEIKDYQGDFNFNLGFVKTKEECFIKAIEEFVVASTHITMIKT